MQLPGISELGTADFAIIAASLGVLGIYLLLSIIRGTIRFILITASTAAGGICAWFTLHYAPGYGGELLKSAPDWVLPGLTVLAGFVGFIVLKSLLFIIFKPITFSSDDDDKKNSGFSVVRSLMALTCGLAMAWGGGVLLRYAGTIAELRLADEQGRDEDTSSSLLWKVADWKQRFELSEIGEWHRSTDPWAEPDTARLAAILLKLQSVEQSADLVEAAGNSEWTVILEKLQDSEIQSLIESGDYSSLLSSDALQDAGLTQEQLDQLEAQLEQAN